MMDPNSPVILTASLATVLQDFSKCHFEFETWTHLTGHLCVVTASGCALNFSINETVFLDAGNFRISSGSFPVIEKNDIDNALSGKNFSTDGMNYYNSFNNMSQFRGNKSAVVDDGFSQNVSSSELTGDVGASHDHDNNGGTGDFHQRIGSDMFQMSTSADTRTLMPEDQQPLPDLPTSHLEIPESQHSQHKTNQDAQKNNSSDDFYNRTNEATSQQMPEELSEMIKSTVGDVEEDPDIKIENEISSISQQLFQISKNISQKKSLMCRFDKETKKCDKKSTELKLETNSKLDVGQYVDLKPHVRIKKEKKTGGVKKKRKSYYIKKEKKVKIKKERPFRYRYTLCNICGLVVSDIKTHEKKHTGNWVYRCDICNKGCVSRTSVLIHMRCHTGEKPYQCKVCGRCFTSNTSLQGHMRLHTGERPFSCEICGKGFTQKTNLLTHLRVHTGEKPFHCTVCGKMFAVNSSLTKHFRQHSGEKPFQCTVCGKGFARSQGLKSHMVTHTGERPYQCKVCGKSFGFPSNLRLHMKMHKPLGDLCKTVGDLH